MNFNFRMLFWGTRKDSFKKKNIVLLLCFSLYTICMQAQAQTITGKVIDTKSEPLIGVSVSVQGTSNGTITDFDGLYSIAVQPGQQLTFSYIGMKTQTITVDSSNIINVTLEDDAQVLSDVVVIGYGSAKSKDLTSQISTIRAEEVSKHLTSSPMQSLQGKVSGMQILNTGQPGSSPKVRIRGIGNFSDANPLYVVDGMFFENIDFLSNDDIENISVLKDASSSAIYGVRAANGVVIITTKKGMPDKPVQITYDGYVGLQKASNVMKMANSREYTDMMKNSGNAAFYDRVQQTMNAYGSADGYPVVDTDWYGELLKTAVMHSHAINISGGSKNINYVVGANYLYQDGIMDVADNGYQRINARAKVDINLLSNLKAGVSFILSSSQKDIAPVSAFFRAYIAPPTLPVYDENNEKASPIKFSSPAQFNYAEYYANPVATAYYNSDKSEKGIQITPSYYAELSLLDNKLTLKSTLSQDLYLLRYQEYKPQYTVSDNQKEAYSELTKKDRFESNYVLDNIITYRDQIDKHSFTLMAGNSIRQERVELQQIKGKDIPAIEEAWYFQNGTPNEYTIKDKWDADQLPRKYRGTSFFGRVMYDYDGRYLISATFRADGSSKYQDKWGYFPSIGLGWVISDEAFMKNQRIVDFAKVRANWGRLGNDRGRANYGVATLNQGSGTSGIFGGSMVPGYTSINYYTDLKWEVVEEYDLGFDISTLNNRLRLEFDYYNRKTKDAIFQKQLPFGAGNLLTNNGTIENKGIEVSVNWADKISNDFLYNVGINFSTLKNKVTKLDGYNVINTGDVEFRTVRMIGETVDSFYGFDVLGVYQNEQEIAADPVAVKNGLEPGDFKYRDVDGDGDITANDRVILGAYVPKFLLGGNLGFQYKNLDFNLSFAGQFGHKIANRKRWVRRWQNEVNFDKDIVKNVWTGPGSTNKYPSAKGLMKTWNIANFNSAMVESASNFSIQNIQIGYTLSNPFKLADKTTSLRISLTAERPFNFFGYNGFTTELGAVGIDEEVYPLSSVYSLGLKLNF